MIGAKKSTRNREEKAGYQERKAASAALSFPAGN
jgi:hypothetical protein